MKVDFNIPLNQLNGEPLVNAKNGAAITLREISVEALLAMYNDETALPPSEKVTRYDIAEKISKSNGHADLTPEELTEVRKLVGKLYSPLIVGQAYRLLG